ncbi:hypothetical protein WJX74_003328 [Apatococcus lobatus]|uniref:Uncharacterized protein n=1 Tax=Apatococcus lobatus TaxID=904363 RepID=A0AAW1PUS1_9CHLO
MGLKLYLASLGMQAHNRSAIFGGIRYRQQGVRSHRAAPAIKRWRPVRSLLDCCSKGSGILLRYVKPPGSSCA